MADPEGAAKRGILRGERLVDLHREKREAKEKDLPHTLFAGLALLTVISVLGEGFAEGPWHLPMFLVAIYYLVQVYPNRPLAKIEKAINSVYEEQRDDY